MVLSMPGFQLLLPLLPVLDINKPLKGMWATLKAQVSSRELTRERSPGSHALTRGHEEGPELALLCFLRVTVARLFAENTN